MNALVFGVLYLFGLPLLVVLYAVLQRKLVHDKQFERAQAKAAKNKVKLDPDEFPLPAGAVIKKRLSFAMKDKRPFTFAKKQFSQNRIVVAIVWAVGLALAAISGLVSPVLFAVAAVVFFVAYGIAYYSPAKLLQQREELISGIEEIYQDCIARGKNPPKGRQAVEVVEWRDLVTPQKIKFFIPKTFSSSGEDGFMTQFNQIYGTETTWVPSFEGDDNGWDYANSSLVIYAVPPLPRMAPWHERYVLGEGVGWSFFPIALGVENGLELPNEETGQIEHVLGYDVSGKAAKVAEKAGLKMSPRITTAPMVLVAGGTGGGKAHPVDTKIGVVVDEDTD